MNARIKKEMRSLQTVSLVPVAVVMVGSYLLTGSDGAGIVATVFALLSPALGVAIFGTEFSARTMGLLLTQPVSRRQLWWEKMMVLGAVLILEWLFMLLCICLFIKGEGRPNHFFDLAGVSFLAIAITFCSAPYLTLTSRNFIGGIAFTIIMPWAVFLSLMLLAWLGAWLTSQPEPWFATAFEKYPDYFILLLLALIYCAVMYWQGYRMFLNYQVADVQVRELSLPATVETKLASLVKQIIPGYTGPMASLIRKELQVQRPTFVVAAVLAVLIVCSRLASIIFNNPAAENADFTIGGLARGFTIAGIAVYLMCAPFVAGIVSMAEERNWGTVGWQLTFPVSFWKQGLVKLAVTYVTAVFLGLIIPLMIALPTGKVPDLFRGEFALPVILWLWSYLPVFSLVVFASSVSTNTMRATALYFGLLTAACAVFGLAMVWVNLVVPDIINDYPVLAGKLYHWSQAWHFSSVNFLNYLMLGIGSLAVCWLVPLIGGMALKNYRKDEINSRRCWIQSSVIVLALGASAGFVAAMVIFINSYEAAYNIH